MSTNLFLLTVMVPGSEQTARGLGGLCNSQSFASSCTVPGTFSKDWLAILVPLSRTAYHQLWSNSFFFLSQRLKKEKAISHRPYKCLHHTKHPTCQSNFPKAFGASLALAHYIVRMAKHMCALFIMVASALSIPGTALAAVPF